MTLRYVKIIYGVFQIQLFFSLIKNRDKALSQSILIGDIEAGHDAGVGTLIFLRGKYKRTTRTKDIPCVSCGEFEEIADIVLTHK